MYFLNFVSMLGWILFLSVRFKKYASYFPFLAVVGIISILYLSGLFGILFFASRGLFCLGFVLPAYLVWKKQLTKHELANLTTSFYLLLVLGVVWFFFTRHAIIFGWDEFAWGQFTKVIYNTNGLYTANSAIMDGKLNYPPGIALFQYYFLGFSRYSEAAIFFSQGIFVFAAVTPILDLVGRNIKKLLVFGLAICMSLVYFGPGLLSMTNDHIIGVAFANAILANFFILRSGKAKLLLIPIIFALPLIKTTGIILSAAIVLAVVTDLLLSSIVFNKDKKPIRLIALNSIAMLIVLTVVSLASMKSWDIYLNSQGAAGDPLPGISKITKSFSAAATKREKTVYKNFKEALIKLSVNYQDGDIKSDNKVAKYYLDAVKNINRPGLSTVGWSVVFAALFGLVIVFQKPKDRILSLGRFVALYIGLGIYVFFHLLAYMYYFSDYEAVNLSSFDRYLTSYFLGIALIIIGMVAVLLRDSSKKLNIAKLFLGIFLVYLFIFHTPSLVRLIVPPSMLAKSTEIIRDKTIPVSDYINAHTEVGSRIWLIYQDTNGWECMMVRYDIVPRKMNGGSGNWSLGDKYGPKDLWTHNITKEEWSAQLLGEHNDYVFLAKVDDNFWNHYLGLFADPTQAKSHQLFKVEQKNDQALLTAR